MTALNTRVGDVIEAGQGVVAVAEQRGFRIDVTVRSEDVGQLRVGMPVRIKLDAYAYQKYGSMVGEVVFVSADSTVERDAATQRPPTYTVKIAIEGEHVGRAPEGLRVLDAREQRLGQAPRVAAALQVPVERNEGRLAALLDAVLELLQQAGLAEAAPAE